MPLLHKILNYIWSGPRLSVADQQLKVARDQLREAEKLGRRQLRETSDAARKRFSEPVLVKLLGVGWMEGRQASPEVLAAAQRLSPRPFPPEVLAILTEFGGLQISSGIGRCIAVGMESKEDLLRQPAVETVVGFPLYPVGWTNEFEDDGLIVYADASGRIFLDGGFNDDEFLVEFYAATFDRALERIFGESLPPDKWPDSPDGSWRYQFEEVKRPAN